jgi:hypothetical protein
LFPFNDGLKPFLAKRIVLKNGTVTKLDSLSKDFLAGYGTVLGLLVRTGHCAAYTS